jgi:uncharacterized protein
MIRMVLDANIYVSALLKPDSNPARIIDMVREGALTLLISEPIIEELQRVLSYPKVQQIHGRSTKGISQFLKRLQKVAVMTPAALLIEAVPNDPTDDKYLVCAVEGRADYIVSGDRHLLELTSFAGIPVVDPARFLTLVAEK